MTVLRRIRDDVLEGKNVDLYLTILLSIVVSLLSFFNLVSASRVAGLIPAVLAILAVSALGTRVAVEDALRSSDRQVFQRDFPPDLVDRRRDSMDTYLVGVSLTRTIEASAGAFERGLRNGGRLRVLLADPDADDAVVDAQCQYTRPGIDHIRGEIRQSIRVLAKVRDASDGNIEVRTSRAALKFGANFVDIGMPHELLHVQLYSYRLSGESRPMFSLSHADGEWFDCFKSQVEALWDDAAVVDLAVRTSP